MVGIWGLIVLVLDHCLFTCVSSTFLVGKQTDPLGISMKRAYFVYTCLSYDVVSESVIKPCIKNDNPLVD